MNENKYLNEEKYQKTKKTLITIGCISIIIAITLLVLAITKKTPEMGQDGWFEAETTRSLMFMGAFVFGLMVPMVTFIPAFQRDINAFNAQSTVPVAKEAANEMAPTAGNLAKEVTKGIKEGLNDKE